MKKIAILELGTLSVKFTVALAQDNDTFVIQNEMQDAIKIASDLYEDWLIKPARIQEVIVILKNYKAYCQANDIQDIECIATSEYFDAKNHSSFFDEIYNKTGFKVRILEKDEQILYNYAGVINSLDVPKGLIISIIGNKAQILNYNRRNLLNQFTFDFGSCSLAEACADKSLSTERFCDNMLKKFTEELKETPWLKDLDPETQIVGLGDCFISLGKLSRKIKKYPYDKDHNYNMSFDDFNKVYDFIKTLEIDKSKKIKGVSSLRADVLAGGLSIIKAIISKTSCSNIVVSENGAGIGLLFNLATPITLEKPITDILGYSLEKNNLYFNNYSKNTSTVYELSMLLYRQLKVLHKLPRTFVKVLRVASTLHDCGMRVDARNYEKNGFDIVLKSDLYGLTHREQILAAFVVACQYSEDFNMIEFIKYRELLEEGDMEAVKKLGIIVRMANALDIYNKNKIKDISRDILGDSVILKTIVDVSAEQEIREALKCEVDFVRAFKKRLEIL